MIILILLVLIVIEIKHSPRLDFSNNGLVLWYSVKDNFNKKEYRDYIKII